MPSHNKRGYAVEAVRSVLEQDFEDWELWIMENSTDEKTRKILKKYIPMDDPRIVYEEINMSQSQRDQFWPAPWLNNQYYPLANGDIVMYISDDDLFMPAIFRHVVTYLDHYEDRHAVYFHLARTRAPSPGTGREWDEQFMAIPASTERGVKDLDCQVDGGQIAYRKSVLETTGQPYFYDGKNPDANHADGMHMEKVARAGFTFYPLPVPGVIHRHTFASIWSPT
jgi:glycosyltransferase involved in cell wall biosynthesis